VKTKMIPIVVCALGTVPIGLEQKPEDNRNNDKGRVASENCTLLNSTYTQESTRV